jgi:hypothetical protein
MDGHVAYIGEMRNHTKFWSENLKVRDHIKDLGIDGRVILELISGKMSGKVRMVDSSGSRQGSVAGSCEHGNEPYGSKKMWGIS